MSLYTANIIASHPGDHRHVDQGKSTCLLHFLPYKNPSISSSFIEGFLFVYLAGGGWFGVSYTPSRAHVWAQVGRG